MTRDIYIRNAVNQLLCVQILITTSDVLGSASLSPRQEPQHIYSISRSTLSCVQNLYHVKPCFFLCPSALDTKASLNQMPHLYSKPQQLICMCTKASTKLSHILGSASLSFSSLDATTSISTSIFKIQQHPSMCPKVSAHHPMSAASLLCARRLNIYICVQNSPACSFVYKIFHPGSYVLCRGAPETKKSLNSPPCLFSKFRSSTPMCTKASDRPFHVLGSAFCLFARRLNIYIYIPTPPTYSFVYKVTNSAAMSAAEGHQRPKSHQLHLDVCFKN
jgi:hypothetical protein